MIDVRTKNTFTFGGVNSGEYGVWVGGSGTFNAPERDVTVLSVPGRNGDLTMDNGRYKNTRVVYPAFIPFGFTDKVAQFRAWLCSVLGYQRLEDAYNPDTFRMARFVGGLDFETRFLNNGAEFSVSFDCQPQRYLISGTYAQNYTEASGGIMPNPTLYSSKPLITVNGSGAGQIVIAGAIISISEIGGSVTIDCDTMNAYNGAENRNNTITVGAWPLLPPGAASYSFSGGVTSIEIIPRWWTL